MRRATLPSSQQEYSYLLEKLTFKLLVLLAICSSVWLFPTVALSQTGAIGTRCSGLSSPKGLDLESTNFLLAGVNLRLSGQSGMDCQPLRFAFGRKLAPIRLHGEPRWKAQTRTLPVIPRYSWAPNPLTITNDTWVGHTGLWSAPGNWSSGIPTSNNNVQVTNSGSVVTEDISGSINNLTVSGNNSLSLNDGINLTINGNAISNTGTIKFSSTGGGAGITIAAGANVTLSGGGIITLVDSTNPQNYIQGGCCSGSTLDNVNNTIQGSGTVGNYGLSITNGGTIDADNADHGLTVNAGGSAGMLNTGTLEATNGATLTLNGTSYNNMGGIIEATGSGSLVSMQVSGTSGVTNTGTLEATNGATLLLNGSTYNNMGGVIQATGGSVLKLTGGVDIQGGSLTASGTGSVIETLANNSATLDGSTQGTLNLSGPFKVVNASTAKLEGTINNTGSITVNGDGNYTYLQLVGNTTLTGSGTVTLADSGYPLNFISGGFALTNQQTIQGSGEINTNSLINQGTINANNADNNLQIALGAASTNTGTLESTNGGALLLYNNSLNNDHGTIRAVGAGSTVQFQYGTIQNSGGTIEATGGGAVQLSSGVAIQGGTLTTDSGHSSIFETVANNSATLDGSTAGTLTNAGSFVVVNGSTLNLNGIINNTGSITLKGDGNNTYLQLLGNTTLEGGGTVTLADSGNPLNFIGGSFTLTNKQTIQGSGEIYTSSLANQGTVDANNADHNLKIATGTAVINTGTLEATNGGTLMVYNDALNNSGGMIKATGASTVQFDYGTIQNRGGTIQATGGSTVQLMDGATIQGGTLSTDSGMGSLFETVANNSATLDGSTLGSLTNAGAFVVENASTAKLNGIINNTGSITVEGDGNNTYLQLVGNTTLMGVGTVTLADAGNPQNRINGSFALTNQQTIQGAGEINTSSLINQGTINANYADNQLQIAEGAASTNSGTLEATNGGTLQLYNDSLNNSGGTIKATGASTLQFDYGTIQNRSGTIQATGGSTVQLMNGATIQGGTLTTDSGHGSVIEIVANNSATLDGSTLGTLTNSGAFVVSNNSTADVNGTIANNGSITLKGDGHYTYMQLIGDTTLMGTGTVTLTNSGNPLNYIDSYGAFTLTNRQTIQGSGTIDTNGLVNYGTIFSNGSGFAISPGSAGFSNHGTLEVATGSSMVVSGGTFTNFAGSTLTGGTYNIGGTLQIDQLGYNGGEITTNAANIILNGANSSFVDANGKDALSSLNTNAMGASFTIEGGRNFTTAANFTNNGTLNIASSNSKFTVNGNLTNFANNTLTGGTYDVTGALQFNGAHIVTNDANITLTGTSSQITDQHGNNGLASFATNGTGASFTIAGGRNFTTAGNFTNNGTLGVASSTSTFVVNGNLSNYATSTETLTGGTYNLVGALQFNGANIVTNAATIVLNGTASKIMDQHGANGLANFATNATGGSFTLEGGRTFTTAGAFTNKGLFTIGSSSTFTVGGTGTSFTQLSGTTTDNGTLAVSSTGSLGLQAGSLFGTGAVNGKITSSGTITPGDSSTSTGVLTDSGAYAQTATGKLDVSIGGTTVGSKYDQLKTTTSSLNGTLNISLINGFVPTIGSTFKIVTFNSETGQFSTVNGLPINSSEHFTITYQGTDVLLTVASGALSPAANNNGFNGSAMPARLAGLNSLPKTTASPQGLSGAQLAFISAGKTQSSSSTFQTALAAVTASSSISPATANLLSATSSSAFSAPSNTRHAFNSQLRFPTRMAANSKVDHGNNGPYGLRGRSYGGGLAVPLSHLSKPQWGLLVQ